MVQLPVPGSLNLTTVLPSLRVLMDGARSFAGALGVKPAAMASKQHNMRAKGKIRSHVGRIKKAPFKVTGGVVFIVLR